MSETELDLADYVSVKPDETGATFQLSRETYKRLASAALSLANSSPNTSTFIRKLKAETGCAVEIFTEQYLFTLSIFNSEISLVVEALDFPNSEAVLFVGQDDESDWFRLRCAANRLI